MKNVSEDDTGRAQPIAGSMPSTVYAVSEPSPLRLVALRWPTDKQASDGTRWVVNQMYRDLRAFSWAVAEEMLTAEDAAMAAASSMASESDRLTFLRNPQLTSRLHELDLGVAGAVAALSAARCVPITSCNAGAFGGRHSEVCPVISFYARAAAVPLLISSAVEARILLRNHNFGDLAVEATEIERMHAFGLSLIAKREEFIALKLPPSIDG